LRGYWVFSKLFQALGDVGYDNNFVVAAAYDWRLSLPVLQRRDAYFTRLKAEVELLRRSAGGQKVVLVSHSFGGVVALTFFEWVERAEKGWTEKNVHAWANLAAPLLGLPKALAPLISGESRETADMMQGVAFLVESYLSRTRRAGMFRTWGSLQTMLPVGGPKVWGNGTHAPDDTPELRAAGRSLGALLTARDDRDSAAGRLGASVTEGLVRQRQQQQQQAPTKRRSLFGTRSAEDAANATDGGSGNSTSGSGTSSSSSGEGSQAGGDAAANATLEEMPLDVDAATRFVGRVAGPNFVANLPRWAGAAQRLDMAATMREAKAEAAARAELLRERAEDDAEEQCSWLSSGAGSCGGGGAGASGKGAGRRRKEEEAKRASASEEEDDDSIDVDRGSGRTPHGNSTRASAVTQAAASLEAVTRAINSALGYGVAAAASASDRPRAPDTADTDTAAAADAANDDDAQHNGSSSSPSSSSSSAAAASPPASSAPRPPQEDVLASAEAPGPEVRALDASVTPLPRAPSLSVYCMYGTGAPTERAYHYAREPAGLGRWAIDTSRSDQATSLDSGVQLSDGDGTVPLISNGALCEGGWRTRRLNPAGSRVVVREYKNEPCASWVDPRGGPKASSHVELLGHAGAMEDVLRIATGFEVEELGDQYHSRIREIAAAIPWKDL